MYRPQGVLFYGIEQNIASGVSQVRSYCTQFNWDFPNGIQNVNVANIFEMYGTARHNYFVIGADGRVVFRAQSGSTYFGTAWSSYEPRIIDAINQALAVPVETTTWSRIKSLYR